MDGHSVDRHLQQFAAAVVHELRTPLVALSGEVEIALRRERPPAVYRETLERVGGLIGELTDLSRDLAIYADLVYAELLQPETALLSDCLDLAGRGHATIVSFAVDETARARRVAGNQSLLARALTLLLNHAVRHRSPGATVRVSGPPAGGAGDEAVVLCIDASPGLASDVWSPLAGAAEGPPIEQAAMFRLPTAARIIGACGGAVDVLSSPGSAAVRIQLLVAQS
jgi:signal transduction histidine kinase